MPYVRKGQPDKDKIKILIHTSQRKITHEIAERLTLSNSIIYDHLKRLDLIAKLERWVPSCDLHLKCLFLKFIITGDEKWALYSEVKRKKSWSSKAEPAQSTSKVDIRLKIESLILNFTSNGDGKNAVDQLFPAKTRSLMRGNHFTARRMTKSARSKWGKHKIVFHFRRKKLNYVAGNNVIVKANGVHHQNFCNLGGMSYCIHPLLPILHPRIDPHKIFQMGKPLRQMGIEKMHWVSFLPAKTRSFMGRKSRPCRKDNKKCYFKIGNI